MGFTEPDSAPVAPGQMPAAPNAGPAPVPFSGDQSAGNAPMAPVSVPYGTPGPGVLAGVTGANYVTEAPLAAPNPNPYEAGTPQAIYVGGSADAGGRDIAAGSVAEAVHNAEARFGELRGDTYGQGSTIGDLMNFPPSPLDPGARPGETLPAGGYYDPPRNYGG